MNEQEQARFKMLKVEVLKKLLEKTQDGSLEWERDEDNDAEGYEVYLDSTVYCTVGHTSVVELNEENIGSSPALLEVVASQVYGREDKVLVETLERALDNLTSGAV